ncbi:MAG: sulfite exporter TauE/SafE family protein [Candidatus Bathyarchaeota archaeon]|nr:sulfite exporter TauE/SafE family protein [Candidatus Bathyarchaeota archaeon]
MSLTPEISNPYLGSFTIGLLYGLGVCTAACLPYVAGYIAGTGADFRKGVKATLLFSSGRILAYALIGALIGFFSELVTLAVQDAIRPFQVYSSMVFGAITIVIGITLLLKARKPVDCSLQSTSTLASMKRLNRFGFDFGAFSLGLSRGLVICPPLLALLLLYALPVASPLGSMTLAILFGLGTAISPLLLLGGVTGWLLNKAPLFRKWISMAGAAVLIGLGALTIVSSLSAI